LQSRLQSFMSLGDLVQMLANAALEAHFKVIQALGLLGKAFARMAQAAAQTLQAQVFAGQAIPQTLA
jgi:hypothetical protein